MSKTTREPTRDRRGFLTTSAASLAAAFAASRVASSSPAPQRAAEPVPRPARIRFAAIGMNHGHINGQTDAVIRGGGELVAFYAKEPELAAAYAKRYPQAKLARSEQEILEDPKIQLVVSASIANERAPLGVRVMRHGKDFMADKPGITTLGQLAEVRKVQAETKRIYSICYSERLENRATVRPGSS
jgi:hypothetical protein